MQAEKTRLFLALTGNRMEIYNNDECNINAFNFDLALELTKIWANGQKHELNDYEIERIYNYFKRIYKEEN